MLSSPHGPSRYLVSTAVPRVLIISFLLLAAACGSGESTEISGTRASDSADTPSAAGAFAVEIGSENGLPTFNWAPQPGATSYGVLVVDANFDLMWIWVGTDGPVVYGALPDEATTLEIDPSFMARFGEQPQGIDGKALVDPPAPIGARVSVLVFDDTGEVIADSGLTPLP